MPSLLEFSVSCRLVVHLHADLTFELSRLAAVVVDPMFLIHLASLVVFTPG